MIVLCLFCISFVCLFLCWLATVEKSSSSRSSKKLNPSFNFLFASFATEFESQQKPTIIPVSGRILTGVGHVQGASKSVIMGAQQVLFASPEDAHCSLTLFALKPTKVGGSKSADARRPNCSRLFSPRVVSRSSQHQFDAQSWHLAKRARKLRSAQHEQLIDVRSASSLQISSVISRLIIWTLKGAEKFVRNSKVGRSPRANPTKSALYLRVSISAAVAKLTDQGRKQRRIASLEVRD